MSVPVAVGAPGVALPASITEPVVVPAMIAASLLPVIVIVTSCAVPSMVVTVKLSFRVSPALSACTALLALSACGVPLMVVAMKGSVSVALPLSPTSASALGVLLNARPLATFVPPRRSTCRLVLELSPSPSTAVTSNSRSVLGIVRSSYVMLLTVNVALPVTA